MHFVRKHDILIDATPDAVFDYVCNPHSWPEWLAASHQIEGPDQPLRMGQTFREEWQIRRGMIELHWTVTESNRPSAWTCQADTDFIGPIIIRYTFALEGGGPAIRESSVIPIGHPRRASTNSSAWTRKPGRGSTTSRSRLSGVSLPVMSAPIRAETQEITR